MCSKASVYSSLLEGNVARISQMTFLAASYSNKSRKLPKNLRYPRRTKLPPEFGVNQFLKKKDSSQLSFTDLLCKDTIDLPKEIDGIDNDDDGANYNEDNVDKSADDDGYGGIIWGLDEIQAISSLFQGRIPQKPGKLYRERPLPLPLPHKLRPSKFPTQKRNIKIHSRTLLSSQIYKNPNVLLGLAREISILPPNEDASKVLNKCARFLRKGSLSLTIRELGHMDLPDRALQTFCWAQQQSHLFPDDRILASTIEILARKHELKVPVDLEKFTCAMSRGVLEAMISGCIKGGSLSLAWKLLMIAKDGKRMLDCKIYASLILELGKNPDKRSLVEDLLEELGQRENLNLSQQNCTSIMKVCIRLGKFETAENLYNWYKESGRETSVVMYVTLIHSRYSEKKYREALAVVWEMEGSNCLLDLPAYRVVIKLFVALGDVSRAVRYFAKLKEAGFSPTFDIYRDLITIYSVSGRMAKCREICREAGKAGFKLDRHLNSLLAQT